MATRGPPSCHSIDDDGDDDEDFHCSSYFPDSPGHGSNHSPSSRTGATSSNSPLVHRSPCEVEARQ